MRRIFWGGQSLPFVITNYPDWYIYQMAGAKKLAHKQCDTEIWEGELDWDWACRSFWVGNLDPNHTSRLRWRIRSSQLSSSAHHVNHCILRARTLGLDVQIEAGSRETPD